jgi:tryptophan-rich sensory protein
LLAAFAGILLAPPAAAATALPSLLSLPPWFFWMVWLVIYPALGIAVWHVWRTPASPVRQRALAYFVIFFLVNIAFLPLTALIPGLWTAFLLDLIGLVMALGLAWWFQRAAPASWVWLLPLLIWLPITTLNKVPGILALIAA